jgi:hypothetical protein
MNLFNKVKSFSPLDILLIIVFIVYIVFPIATPDVLKPYIDSPLGIIFLFVVTISLFVYTNPILGVLYILVAYEVLRRNSVITRPATTRMDGDSSWYTDPVAYVNNVKPSAIAMAAEPNKDEQLKAMNPRKQMTLEEEIVKIRAPVGVSEQSAYINSAYKPVADKVYGGGSVI